MFEIKDGYKLELQTPETMKLFGDKNNNRQNKKMEKKYQVLKLLKQFQSNIIQQIININKTLEVLYTFTPNKSCAYLLNVKPSNLLQQCDNILQNQEQENIICKKIYEAIIGYRASCRHSNEDKR